MNDRPFFVIAAHIFEYICVIYGHTRVSSSFLSDNGFYFYLYTFLVFTALVNYSGFSKAPKYRVSELSDKEKCSICLHSMAQGDRHCSKCDLCVNGWIFHCALSDTCIGMKNGWDFLMFCVVELVTVIVSLFESCHALHHINQNVLFGSILGLTTPFLVWYGFQTAVYLVFIFKVAILNSSLSEDVHRYYLQMPKTQISESRHSVGSMSKNLLSFALMSNDTSGNSILNAEHSRP